MCRMDQICSKHFTPISTLHLLAFLISYKVELFSPVYKWRKQWFKEHITDIKRKWDLTPGHLVLGASLKTQWVKNPPAMQEIQETQVRSLGREDSLESEVATHSGILAWKIPWAEEPGYSPWGHKELNKTDWPTVSFFFPFSFGAPYLKIYIFIYFGCTGSSLLHVGFL